MLHVTNISSNKNKFKGVKANKREGVGAIKRRELDVDKRAVALEKI